MIHFLLLALTCTSGQEIEPTLQQLLSATREESVALISQIVAAEPDVDDVLATLRRGIHPSPSPARAERLVAGWSAWSAVDSEGVSRPYQMYLPEAVANGEQPAALLVHLHGSVARADYGEGLGSPQATGYGSILWPSVADSEGIVLVCPQGREDCVWWSEAGRRHVLAVVRDVRRSLPIPGDSILASGFSDGASGCYYLAMAAPDPFAGFIALNGHPAVAASASGKQLYLQNMAASSTFAGMTQEDSLYPTRAVLPHLTTAIEAGAPVHVVSYPEFNHQPSYFDDQRIALTGFLGKTKRNDDRAQIRWRTSDLALGKARWLEVLALGDSANDAAALPDPNHMTAPGRVRLGVQLDSDSVRVVAVVGDSLAGQLGVVAGDAIRSVNARETGDRSDLRAALSKLTHGDTVRVIVERDGRQVELDGTIPPFVPAPIFLRTAPTVHVDCVLSEGRDGKPHVAMQSRGARKVRVWLPPTARAHRTATSTINGQSREVAVRRVSLEELLHRFANSGATTSIRSEYIEATY